MPDAGDLRVRHSRISSMLGTRMSDSAPNVSSNRDYIRRSRSSEGAAHDGTGRGTRPRRVLLFVDLDKVTPPDHLVRQIDAVLDLNWVHKELALYYSLTR
jgi:hypothetical protein